MKLICALILLSSSAFAAAPPPDTLKVHCTIMSTSEEGVESLLEQDFMLNRGQNTLLLHTENANYTALYGHRQTEEKKQAYWLALAVVSIKTGEQVASALVSWEDSERVTGLGITTNGAEPGYVEYSCGPGPAAN